MIFIHKTADVSEKATIGKGSKIWNNAQIREYVTLGRECVVGTGAYIDHHIAVGDNCRIQNHASIYFQTIIEANVFIGPQVCIINDKLPRAVLPDGRPKQSADWQSGRTVVKTGASIGAGSIILPNITVGKWAMVGAGSVVTKNVPDYGVVFGVPAIFQGFVCPCGGRLQKQDGKIYRCKVCGMRVVILL